MNASLERINFYKGFVRGNANYIAFTFLLIFEITKISKYAKKFISHVPDQWTVIIGLNDSLLQNHVANIFPATRFIAQIMNKFSQPFYVWFIFNLIVWIIVLTLFYFILIAITHEKIFSLLIVTLFISNQNIYSNLALPYSQTHWSLPLFVVFTYILLILKGKLKAEFFGFIHLAISLLCFIIFSSSIIFVNIFILSILIFIQDSGVFKKVNLSKASFFIVIHVAILTIQKRYSTNFPSVDPGANIMFFGENYLQRIDFNATSIELFLKVFAKTQLFWLNESFGIFTIILLFITFSLFLNLEIRKRITLSILAILSSIYLLTIFIVRFDGSNILNYGRYFMYIFPLLVIPLVYLINSNKILKMITSGIFIVLIFVRFGNFDDGLNAHLSATQLSSLKNREIQTNDEFERSWAIKIVQVCLSGNRFEYNRLKLLSNSNSLSYTSTCGLVDHWFDNPK